ncbi:hypothetical protein ACFOY5_09200 [Massilia aurea]|uniref:hypothetical protein n=1 Tax=Massilia aurea TaxID=373040 RepID=UPI00216148BB|nr:hypothetical protein [Massilia aurea]MCS0709920.1 hypothetical protein [Massilia aurea]
MSYSKKAAREAAKLKREPGTFAAVPFAMLRSQSFAALSPQANKLLFDLLAQYNLRNNGDLSMSFEKTMRPRGWKSKDTLNKARLELIEAGFILLTRQRGLHQCSLYAVTFYAVDYCEGKLEMSATRTALSNWRKNEPLKNKEPSTRSVPVVHRLGTPAVL